MPPANVSRAAEESLRAAFAVFDTEGTGNVKSIELDLLLGSAGIKPGSAEDLQAALRKVGMSDSRPDAAISFQIFFDLVKELSHPRDSAKEAERVFRLCVNGGSHKSGAAAAAADAGAFVSIDSLREALAECDARVSNDELAEIVKYCSLSGDARGISLQDWCEVTGFVSEIGW